MPNNYKKSFNFRNGVQVDDDNFIINANGLVGIGTSSPTEILDVYGTVKVTGVVTATQVTSPTLSATKVINVGVTSITSGIISATTGLVTYYGDGGKLLNIPTSQWIDVNPGLGITSIYAAGNVGIATTSPVFTFQVGSNPLVVSSGIGINSTGDVYTAGVVTALSFSGIGSNLASLNASNISSGTISTSVFPSNIGVSGTITALAFSGSGAGVTSLNASNITSGTISTSVFPSNIGVSGTITALAFVGNLTGTATTATNLAPSGTISITSVNSGFSSTGIATITQNLYVVGFPAKIGVGTVSAPEADVEVNKLGISSIRVISSNNVATIGIGRSAEIRTGNLNVGSYPYSTANSLDIINSNPGNLNYYLDYGSAGLGTGNFNWIYGQDSFNPRMTLTYDGKLGIGITDPTTKLYVVGTSYFSSTSTFDGNLFVTGSGTSITGNDIYGSSFTATGSISGQSISGRGTIPIGCIVMWSGSIATIPTGWALCNGSNGTPDLRERFIVGAGGDNSTVSGTTGYNPGDTGGSNDAIVVSHSHAILDPGHTHDVIFDISQGPYAPSSFAYNGVSEYVNRATKTNTTGISVQSFGDSGTNANRPPYYALAFIMRVS